jgi:hypothetical protein
MLFILCLAGTSLNSTANSGSFESSPQSGPSRSASIRVKDSLGHRVTFSDTQNVCGSRQSSLPSVESDLSLHETEWKDEFDPDVELRRKTSPSRFDHTDGK